MRLYCIIRDVSESKLKTYGYLKAACEKRQIEFITLESHKADLTDLPELGKGDLLYRLATDKQSSNIAAQLINDNVATFYTDSRRGSIFFSSNGWSNTILHRRLGLPVIPTIIGLPKDHAQLAKYVEKLGGFPIVLKAQGGSHGIGVMRFDSLESLVSVADYLTSMMNPAGLALRQYIDYKTHARLIVVGDKVVDSIEYERPDGDFRSNVGSDPDVKVRKFSAEVEKAAVDATHAIGHEFGGVDILIDTDDKFYIAEVNHPCNFARSQGITGFDIAGAMVDHLAEKSKKLGTSHG